ncbi:MAG: hypothetical protein R6U15_00205 [Candidatus Izemoplasmatales bacterium]
MINYIKLHFAFLMNNLMIISIFVLQIITISGIIYASNILKGYSYMDSYREELSIAFFSEAFMIIEVVLAIIAIFIATILQTKTNNYLMFYTTYSNKEKLNFIIGKLLAGMIVIVFLLLINYLTFKVILYLSPFDIDINLISKTIMHLLVEAFQLFSFTLAILTLLNHFFISIIPIILFWYLEIISMNPTNFNELLLKIFLNINPYIENNINLEMPILFTIFYLSIYIFISYKKDCC